MWTGEGGMYGGWEREGSRVRGGWWEVGGRWVTGRDGGGTGEGGKEWWLGEG